MNNTPPNHRVNRVTKTVSAEEAEKTEAKAQAEQEKAKARPALLGTGRGVGQKRQGGVLAGVLGPKPKKMTTLEKSKLDWQKFRAKDEDGLAESLDRFAKSGDGYLAQKAFLERANAREYEHELEAKRRTRNH